jgi:hypothetical protein
MTRKLIIKTLLSAMLLPAVATADLERIGIARDPDSGEVLYYEYHYVPAGGSTRVVDYKDPDDRLITEKTLQFNGNGVQPEMVQVNHLSGEEITIRSETNRGFMLEYKQNFRANARQKSFSADSQLVIDAGFDEMIRRSWDTLLSKGRVDFDYLAPSRQRTFSLTVQPMTCRVPVEDARCFSAAPSAWVLRKLLDPIELVYHNSTQQLLNYRGLGNIADTSGKYMKIDIVYEYPDA